MLRNLEKLVFFTLVFSIPFQKRIFLFGTNPESGNFNEWVSGFFYFTDFLVLALASLWLGSIIFAKGPEILKLSWRWKEISLLPATLFLFLFFAFISITQADLIDVGAYRFIKLAEFVFIFFYVAYHVKSGTSHIRAMLWAFVSGGVFQAVIGILQFAKQSSLGLEIFHESTLEIGMRGVAQITPSFAEGFGGQGALEMIRAYGTFTNPNVLAGFLGICLLFAFYLFLTMTSGYGILIFPFRWLRFDKQYEPRLTQKRKLDQSKIGIQTVRFCYSAHLFVANLRQVVSKLISRSPSFYLPTAISLLSFAFLLTFSRGVIIFFLFTSALFFVGVFLFKELRQYRKLAVRLLVLIIVSWLLIIVLMWPELSSRFLESSVSEPAVSERFFFNKVGVETASQNYSKMFFGIGIGNFVNYYMGYLPDLAPHLYQPVHNIFILIASEIGILGLFGFVLFLSLLVGQTAGRFFGDKKNSFMRFSDDRLSFVYVYTLLSVAVFMLFISMYDHYFWTLQQGSLMFWIVFGLLASISANKKPARVGAGS